MIYVYKNTNTNKIIPLKEKMELDYLKLITPSLDLNNSFLKSSDFILDINNSFLNIKYNSKVSLAFIETNIRIISVDNNYEPILLSRNEYIISYALVSKDKIIYNYSIKNASPLI